MQVTDTKLDGVKIIEPRVFNDNRGFFFESFQQLRYDECGMNLHFAQDNISRSSKNVLRGLHYQLPHEQGKLVYVIRGAVLDIAVDIRHGSPTFAQYVAVVLDDIDHKQLYVPPGFAHGFVVLSDTVDYGYKCTNYYKPEAEHGILWNDPSINIDWGVEHPLLSEKDKHYLPLIDVPLEHLPKYKP